MQEIFQLKKYSQSNSSITVLETKNGLKRVRKTSISDHARFYRQYQKHIEALSLKRFGINSPKVLSIFDSNAYEMEYVAGLPLGESLHVGTSRNVEKISWELTQYFKNIFNQEGPYETSELVIEKLNEIVSQSKLDVNYPSVFSLLANKIKTPLKGVNYIKGWNHGDFSFENLIVTKDNCRLYYLDFLDSPFDSPILDLARFWLDLEYGWWGAGFHPSANYELNIKLIQRDFKSLLFQLNIEVQYLNLFTALTLLRIVPYTRNPLRMAFLKNTARGIMDRIT